MEHSASWVIHNEDANLFAAYVPEGKQDIWIDATNFSNRISHRTNQKLLDLDSDPFSTATQGETENRQNLFCTQRFASTKHLENVVKQNTESLTNGNIQYSIRSFSYKNMKKYNIWSRLFDEIFRNNLLLWDYELFAALNDLQEVKEEAQEEGFPIPTPVAFDNAERCLREMYAISPRRYEVYPTHDGEIVIDAPSGFGTSVVLMCDSDGGALCLANLEIGQRHRRYASVHALPDDFLHASLISLERERN